MPRRPPPLFRNGSATLVGYFEALARAASVPPREAVRATLPAVRLAWDRGGGRAVADARLPLLRNLDDQPYGVGADDAESVLEALERWAADPTLPLAEIEPWLDTADDLGTVSRHLYRRVRDRHAPREAINERPLIDRLDREGLRGALTAFTAHFVLSALSAVAHAARRDDPQRRMEPTEEAERAYQAQWAAKSLGWAAQEAAQALYALGEREVLRAPPSDRPRFSRRTRPEPLGGARPAADAMVLAAVKAAFEAPARPAPPPSSPSSLSRRENPRRAGGWPSVTLPEGSTLFHGSIEPFEGPLRPGGDGVLWFSDSPQIAQLYIPPSGGSVLFRAESLDRPPSDPTLRALLARLGIEYDYDQVEYDASGRRKSWPSPRGWTWPEPTPETIARRLEALGWPRKEHGGYEVRTHLGRPLAPGEFIEGRLFVARTLVPLRLWKKSLGEGDLTAVQYHDLRGFKAAREAGFDGVLIDDFAQSEAWGNLGHLSVGLFDRTLPHLSVRSVPARYREWDRGASGTPEWPAPPPPFLHRL